MLHSQNCPCTSLRRKSSVLAASAEVSHDNRRSDYDINRFPIEQTLMEFYGRQCDTKLCKEGNCLSKCVFGELLQTRHDYWNKFGGILTREDRRKKNMLILTRAYREEDGSFKFCIGNQPVCELSFLKVLGLLDLNAHTAQKRLWIQCKIQVTNPNDPKYQYDEIEKVLKTSQSELLRSGKKTEHAITFVKYISNLMSEPGYDMAPANVQVLPYEHVSELYEEYIAFHSCAEFDPNGPYTPTPHKVLQCAKETTFRDAFRTLYDQIRLRGCKGSFDTCAICNTINDQLKSNSRKWTKSQYTLVMKVKRLHLTQQANERRDSEARKILAREVDSEGNFTSAYFEADGYTEYKCLTPKNYYNRQSKGDTSKMANRVIGVIVICGKIETRFVYSLDELVYGGANTMIEVMRQAFGDLSNLLNRKYKMPMPKTLFLQFDNCGENKNK